ncbi:MAG TPA: hypothetical protein VIL46_15130, partial [Gemmataceae bacterium]
MNRRRFLALGLCLTGLGLPGGARADEHPYAVTPEAGPWLIFVQSYTGPMARDLAHELVTELRREYKLAAYFYNHGEEERQKERQRVAALLKRQEEFLRQFGGEVIGPRRIRTVRIPEQYAVLVGGWPDMDTARRALEGIRKLDPPSKKLMDIAAGPVPVTEGGQVTGTRVQKMYLNPFLTAFVAPNPTIPRDHADPLERMADPILKDLNADEEYSLLKCKKPWTLAVRVYHGPSVIQTQGAADSPVRSGLGFLKRSQEYLSACGKQAHAIAAWLRQMKPTPYEAYVLHTQYY